VTKKDYVAIAAVLRQADTAAPEKIVREIAEKLSEVFAADNPRFDRERFKTACLSW